MFEPFKITAYPQCGIISDAYLPIDAVLYYQVHRDQLGAQDVTLPGARNVDGGRHHPLPLQKVNTYKRRDSRLWFYAASFAQWSEPYIEGTDHWNKRMDVSLIDLVDWQGRKPRLEVSSGRYKSYHMPVFYRHALSVSWHVVGDGGEIERLLRHVTHLGKKYAQGWGSILRWDIESWPEDWSVWGPERKLMRAIPSEEPGAPVYGLKPSYWFASNQVPCRLP